MRRLIVALFITALPLLTQARDGAIEINQAHALAGSVTPGDLPGFPVTLTVSGRYLLTSNLSPPAAAGAGATSAIQVEANNVDIHLNGFALLGPCAVDCGPTAMAGIASSQQGLHVRQGLIRDFPGSGIAGGRQTVVEDVFVINNSGRGVDIGPASIVRRVIAIGSGGDGINADTSVVEHNVLLDNGLDGIECDDCTVTGNAARENAGIGLTGFRSVFWANAAWENATGMVARSGFVRGNSAHDSTGSDISLDPDAGYVHNNSGKPIVGGTSLGTGLNLCGSTLCP